MTKLDQPIEALEGFLRANGGPILLKLKSCGFRILQTRSWQFDGICLDQAICKAVQGDSSRCQVSHGIRHTMKSSDENETIAKMEKVLREGEVIALKIVAGSCSVKRSSLDKHTVWNTNSKLQQALNWMLEW